MYLPDPAAAKTFVALSTACTFGSLDNKGNCDAICFATILDIPSAARVASLSAFLSSAKFYHQKYRDSSILFHLHRALGFLGVDIFTFSLAFTTGCFFTSCANISLGVAIAQCNNAEKFTLDI